MTRRRVFWGDVTIPIIFSHNDFGGLSTGTGTAENEELRILSVRGGGEELLQDESDSLFTASELQAFTSLSPDHDVPHDSLMDFATGRDPTRGMPDHRNGQPERNQSARVASTIMNPAVEAEEDDGQAGQPSHVGQFDQQQNAFSHGVLKSLDCSFCGERFLSREDLIAHRASHTGEPAALCTFCGKSFVNKTTLSIHMRIHTGEKPYACAQCGKRFTQNGSLKIHLRTHSGEKPYTCSQCAASFNNPSNLRRHMITHNPNGFRFPSALRSHKPFCKKLRALMAKQATSANPPKPQSPGVENLTAPSKETPAVNESAPSSNGRRESSTQKAESAKKHACTHCNMSFNSSTRLREHVRVHTGERPYLCSACPKKFAVKQALKKHMSRMHEGQADVSEAQADTSSNWKTVGTRCREGFICALCPRLLRTRFMLSEHFRTHTGEKPLKCEQCSATFRFRGQLSLHKKRCAGPQPVTECAKCQKTFATQARYLKHMSSFHKDRSFCKICGKVFLTKGRLRNHMERFHQ
uniref:C2H2-type domain-containing protein n=1 Tax=Gasterosteus aculeatus aculeatus TaxID=481459 RepID=A0AAQ4PLT5_GASAC